MSFASFVQGLWQPQSKDLWLANEPITDWDLTFFSRTMPRGEHLSIDGFNLACHQHSSDYFREIWKSGKIVLDFLNKGKIPAWWERSKIVSLDADISDSEYRQRLLDKLYPWDPVTHMGLCMMDKPMPEQKYHNAILFDNQWQHGPFETSDHWLDWVIANDARINFTMHSPATITMDDLVDYHKVRSLIAEVARDLNSDFEENDLRFLHEYWCTWR
jgi:hypothetical protein